MLFLIYVSKLYSHITNEYWVNVSIIYMINAMIACCFMYILCTINHCQWHDLISSSFFVSTVLKLYNFLKLRKCR